MFSELSNQVFGQELILEIILEYATCGGSDSTEVQKCRLVNKSWLLSISKYHRKNSHALFNLEMGKHGLVSGMSLVQFIEIMTRNSRLTTFISPFKMHLKRLFFREENYESLVTLLEECGSGLVELSIEFPCDGGTMPFIFPTLSLPMLKTITINFVYVGMDGTDMELCDGSNNNAIYLLQSLFDSSKVLTNFEIVNDGTELPGKFGYLRVPSTTKTVVFYTELEKKDVKILSRKPLPNLKALIFNHVEERYESGVLYQALSDVSRSLEIFRVEEGLIRSNVPRERDYFRFPFMQNLKSVEIDCWVLELENDLTGDLGDLLPMLEKLELSIHTKNMLWQWTKSSRFENVKELKISLVDENLSNKGLHYLNIDMEIMQNFNRAFPNVTSLDIVIAMHPDRRNTSGIQYLFLEMTQLEELVVCVHGGKKEISTEFCDTLLTGVNSKNLSGVVDLEPVSITNLSRLKKLSLTSPLFETPNPGSLISDVVFHQAFLTMPVLKELEFKRSFKASDEIVVQWKAEGRTIIC